jgi:hypothetical protein
MTSVADVHGCKNSSPLNRSNIQKQNFRKVLEENTGARETRPTWEGIGAVSVSVAQSPSSSISEQMLDDQLVERLVVATRDEFIRAGLVEGARFFD